MERHLAIVALGVIAAIACGPGGQSPGPAAKSTSAADREAITQVREQYVAAENAADASGIAALYAEGAVFMPPNEPAISGKQGIEAWYQKSFDQYTPNISVSSQETEVAGDWAFDRGAHALTLTPKAGGDAMEISGKHVVLLKKQADGSWKITTLIWNGDKPMPGMGQ